jgi:2-methylisocitrate lyase-like PEP mutase family enzyme
MGLMTTFSELAASLRALHRPGEPLVLANAWDAASARVVVEAGYPAVATTSGGVARSLGEEDTDAIDPDVAYAAVARIARAVGDVPVTADIVRGYGRAPGDIVERLRAAGAVGCNLEDTDHYGDAALVGVDEQAAFLAAVKDAGRRAGVDLVVNARIDVFVRNPGEPTAHVGAALERGRAYLDAGVDCVYPIGLADADAIHAIVDALDAPVNVLLRPGAPSIAELAALGVARVSVGSALARHSLSAAARAATALRQGDPTILFGE